jgi:hypothetical protein
MVATPTGAVVLTAVATTCAELATFEQPETKCVAVAV